MLKLILKLVKNNESIDKIYRYFLYRIIPSKMYINRRFRNTFGFKLNIKDPKTFNEKLQWKKFYDRKSIYTLCSDKYLVREYAKKKIGKEYLIPLLFATEDPNKIPFETLEYPYIIKSNHGSSRNIFIHNKNDIDKNKIISECKNWLKENYYYYGKEWQYKNIKPKIVIEKLLLDDKNNIPNDYKFHCFNGQVEFIQVDSNRFNDHKRTIFDINWDKMPFIYSPNVKSLRLPKYKEDLSISKPVLLKEMLKIASILASDFNYVRVDLYNLNQKIYFGELTFIPEAGFGLFFPNKYDLLYGEKLKIKYEKS